MKTTDIQHLDTFTSDILDGLRQNPKRLPSKYFYDAEGDKLFQQIMRMPEYYLTDAEYEIMEMYKDSILKSIGCQAFDLVELGAGDGYKTKVLLQYLLEQNVDVRYCPIDISKHVLQQLETSLQNDLPELAFNCLQGDYFDMLNELHYRSEVPKIILFLGANIGNMRPPDAQAFLKEIQKNMSHNDRLIVGFDLKKDPQIILDAYNDPAGITAAFNLNLLTRINKELGANFNIDLFKHWEIYNPLTGAAKSYIISKIDQDVFIPDANQVISFAAWETIEVELSQKYSLADIDVLAHKSGLTTINRLRDHKKYFVDIIFQKS